MVLRMFNFILHVSFIPNLHRNLVHLYFFSPLLYTQGARKFNSLSLIVLYVVLDAERVDILNSFQCILFLLVPYSMMSRTSRDFDNVRALK